MALDLLTSTVDRAHIVLDIDPDVRAANPQAALDAYRESSDINDLVVPDGATVFEVRALTRTERKKVEAAAGRRSDLGAIMYQRVDSAGTAAAVTRYESAMREAIAKRLPEGVMPAAKLDEAREQLDEAARGEVERIGLVAFNAGYGEGYARAVEALSDGEEQALRRFELWLDRYQLALCSRSVCGVEGITTLLAADGSEVPARQAGGVFPFELYLEAYERHAARGGVRHGGAVLLRQLAHHCEQVSRLGKGGRRRSGSPPGTTTISSSPDGPASPASSAAETPTSTG